MNATTSLRAQIADRLPPVKTNPGIAKAIGKRYPSIVVRKQRYAHRHESSASKPRRRRSSGLPSRAMSPPMTTSNRLPSRRTISEVMLPPGVRHGRARADLP